MKREPLLPNLIAAILLFAAVLFVAMALHSSILPEANGSERSGKWSAVERAQLASHPNCQRCGRTPEQCEKADMKLQVHHKRPFHAHPELELDPDNLITLCDECHGTDAHLDRHYKSWNPLIEQEAKLHRAMVEARPTTDKEAAVFVKRFHKCFDKANYATAP